MDFLAIPVMAIINRFRGGGFYADRLPGHPRYWTAPLAGAVAYLLTTSVTVYFIVGLGWLLWALPPWGLLMCLGRFKPPRDIDPFELYLLEVGETVFPWAPYHAALYVRHCVVLPTLVGLWLAGSPGWVIPLAAPFALLVTLGYEAAWRLAPSRPIMVGELAAGALWGGLLLIAV